VAVTKFHTSSAEHKHPQLCAFERVGEKEMLLIYELHLLGSFKRAGTCSREQQSPSDSLHTAGRDEAGGRNGRKQSFPSLLPRFCEQTGKPSLRSGRADSAV